MYIPSSSLRLRLEDAHIVVEVCKQGRLMSVRENSPQGDGNHSRYTYHLQRAIVSS